MKKTSFTGRHIAFFLFSLVLAGSIFSCEEKDKDLVKPKTVLDVLKGNTEFSTFYKIVQGAKLNDGLRTENITLFVPNDRAFEIEKITADSILSLPADSVKSFILYHIAGTVYETTTWKKGTQMQMLNKKKAEVVMGTDTTIVHINKALIVKKNINADNGIIQVLNKTMFAKE